MRKTMKLSISVLKLSVIVFTKQTAFYSPLQYSALLPSPPHLYAFVAALTLIAIVSIGFFTSNLHFKIQILEDQLRSKIGEYDFDLF